MNWHHHQEVEPGVFQVTIWLEADEEWCVYQDGVEVARFFPPGARITFRHKP